jgi:putative NADH-flavin reductase
VEREVQDGVLGEGPGCWLRVWCSAQERDGPDGVGGNCLVRVIAGLDLLQTVVGGGRQRRAISAAADVLDRAALAEALTGADAVVSAAGIRASRQPTAVYSEGTANILRAMDAHGISKLAVISAVPAGPRAEQPFLQRHVSIPILERIFGATYDDMHRMETLLRGSPADWVCLRPPRLVGKKAAGRNRIDASRPLPKAGSITYADLATALLDSLTRPDLYRRIAYVAS